METDTLGVNKISISIGCGRRKGRGRGGTDSPGQGDGKKISGLRAGTGSGSTLVTGAEILLKCNKIPGNIDAEIMVCYTEH